jgi:drug/metabolite transporter (DMT)-like permease
VRVLPDVAKLAFVRRDTAVANASACIAAILFGASVVAVRIAVREIPPLTLALLRFGQGAVVLLIGLALFRRDRLRIDLRDLPYLGLLGAIFFAIFPTTFNMGMRFEAASRGALLLATMPLWTLIIARFSTGERLKARQTLGVLVSIAGVGIVMAQRTGSAEGSLEGDSLLIATALCGAIYNVLAKRMLAKYGGLTVSFYAMLIGALLLTPALAVEHSPSPSAVSAETMWMVLFLGVLGGALAFSLWTSALRRLTPTRVAVYINLNPMSAALVAALLLHERLTFVFTIGFFAVAAGVMIVNWSPPIPVSD